jgi:hypothetical protein
MGIRLRAERIINPKMINPKSYRIRSCKPVFFKEIRQDHRAGRTKGAREKTQ